MANYFYSAIFIQRKGGTSLKVAILRKKIIRHLNETLLHGGIAGKFGLAIS